MVKHSFTESLNLIQEVILHSGQPDSAGTTADTSLFNKNVIQWTIHSATLKHTDNDNPLASLDIFFNALNCAWRVMLHYKYKMFNFDL